MTPMTYVLRVEVVREAITALRPLYIHETFPVYLHLRRRAAVLRRWTDLQPDFWDEPASWLGVPGGPPGKPNFRPFTSRGSGELSYWMGGNLAGSYQQSSLRGLKNLYIDTGGTGEWRLPTLASGEPDAEQVSRRLLRGQPIPAWAVAAYLYRNRAFTAADPVDDPREAPSWPNLLNVFQRQFRWTESENELLWNRADNGLSLFERWSGQNA